ncbi:class F sortase [Couchioplanes caeruleus]|uniref:class F sortase n=1 Tax=Couchioplanes caeruleus TaxID=56438 RepID=UPI0020C0ED80|nr:class F sortase [Couchioplanes caeruleus]UQU62809.1 class F sortase [Couchioplanes caeruleus]
MPAYARTAALAGLTTAMIAVLTGAAPPVPRPGGAAPVAPTDPAPVAADRFRSARTYTVVARPVRLRIRALHVDSALQRLGLQRDGTVEVPARPDVAGWYEGGPRPGQPGPAVLLGHVDSRRGPGVFARLSTVRPGTLIAVDRADGSTVTFRVTGVSQTSKTAFPTDLVYAPTLDATLRLVTCGGSFDRARGSYRDNVIVFADHV